MAVATTQFIIAPADGWVAIATNPASLLIKPDEANSWRLAVTTGASPSNGVQATGTINFTGVPADAGTVTVGTQVYTFKTALTPAANEVLRGVDAAATAANLAAAINAGAGAGVTYAAATVANVDVTAAVAAGVVTVSSRYSSVAGNSVALVDNATNMTVSGALLTGGVDVQAGALFGDNRSNIPVGLGGFVGKAWIKSEQTTAHFNVLQDVGGGGSGGGGGGGSGLPATLTGGVLALTGASQTVVAAGAGSNKIILFNPIGNGTVTLDLAGAAVVAGAGFPLPAGGTLIIEPGVTNAITGIGTAAQNIYVFKG